MWRTPVSVPMKIVHVQDGDSIFDAADDHAADLIAGGEFKGFGGDATGFEVVGLYPGLDDDDAAGVQMTGEGLEGKAEIGFGGGVGDSAEHADDGVEGLAEIEGAHVEIVQSHFG